MQTMLRLEAIHHKPTLHLSSQLLINLSSGRLSQCFEGQVPIHFLIPPLKQMEERNLSSMDNQMDILMTQEDHPGLMN